MTTTSISSTSSKPARLSFASSQAADLFTREVEESFQGVLTRNLIDDPGNPMHGFVSASIDGRPWTDTMWTRDAGVFLRELVLWGKLEQAVAVAERLIDLVRPNAEGYCTFPMFFKLGEPGSGSELDGTASILIGIALLWERLEKDHPARLGIERFLDADSSPLAYILQRIEDYPLIPGSGEFGGGLGNEGEFYNVVQNNLVRLALLAVGRLLRLRGISPRAQACRLAAEKIESNMLRYLRDPGGAWMWAVSPDTLQPDPQILDHLFNKGMGGINGVLSMTADVCGFTPLESGWEGMEACRKTFDKLFTFPKRRAMFDKYGVWTQFDEFCNGFHTGPSYGHGYATQAMLLMDRLEMAGRAMDFLAEVTHRPFRANYLDRDSDYYFYERIYLPELLEQTGSLNDWQFNVYDGEKFDQGCGALNLVCAAEPLKIARLVAGVDDSAPEQVKIVPRLPPSWSGYHAENWPILSSAGLARADIRCERSGDGLHFKLIVLDGPPILSLAVRMPQGIGWEWQYAQDVTRLEVPW